jgi:hypothetical protein
LYALFLITKEGLERRQFLKHSSALGLSLALALTNKLEAQDMSEEITSMSASELSSHWRFGVKMSDASK